MSVVGRPGAPPFVGLDSCGILARAAAIRPGETFLEPSAGTGALAAFAVLGDDYTFVRGRYRLGEILVSA